MKTISNKKESRKKRNKINQFRQSIQALIELDKKEIEALDKPTSQAIAKGFSTMTNQYETQLYLSILLHLYKQGCYKLLIDVDCLQAFATVCYFRDKMLRPVEAWKKDSKYFDKQFQSFLHHLFAKYPMPLFFDKVWFEEDVFHQTWYTEVAQGTNIRKCHGLPFEMSKKMSFYFMNAPTKYSIQEAFKWSKVMILGGDVHLAQQLIQHNLVAVYDNSERMNIAHWKELVAYLSNKRRIPNNKIVELFDYLRFKYGEQEFSLKGRKITSLIRDSDLWHYNHEEVSNQPAIVWNKSKIKDMVFRGKNNHRRRKYEVIELTTSHQLAREGKRMKHCVGGYTNACQTGVSAIFSIRRGYHSYGTLEINLKERKVVQAKSTANQQLCEIGKSILRRWANRNKLKIAEEL